MLFEEEGIHSCHDIQVAVIMEIVKKGKMTAEYGRLAKVIAMRNKTEH